MMGVHRGLSACCGPAQLLVGLDTAVKSLFHLQALPGSLLFLFLVAAECFSRMLMFTSCLLHHIA